MQVEKELYNLIKFYHATNYLMELHRQQNGVEATIIFHDSASALVVQKKMTFRKKLNQYIAEKMNSYPDYYRRQLTIVSLTTFLTDCHEYWDIIGIKTNEMTIRYRMGSVPYDFLFKHSISTSFQNGVLEWAVPLAKLFRFIQHSIPYACSRSEFIALWCTKNILKKPPCNEVTMNPDSDRKRKRTESNLCDASETNLSKKVKHDPFEELLGTITKPIDLNSSIILLYSNNCFFVKLNSIGKTNF